MMETFSKRQQLTTSEHEHKQMNVEWMKGIFDPKVRIKTNKSDRMLQNLFDFWCLLFLETGFKSVGDMFFYQFAKNYFALFVLFFYYFW